MKFGAIYPQIELGGDPAAVDSIGRAVESLGYDYLLMFDHVAGAVHADRRPPLAGPYTEKDPFHDPFVAFGYLAGVTRTIGLVTGILVLPQRQTLLAARQAADVDLFSGGRLRLGVGVGWNHVEFDALGQDFRSRGARLDEQIGYLRRLWEENPLSFEGRFDRIERAGLNPRPRRRIPIFCGGSSEAAYRRGARLADGFIFSGDLEEGALPGWNRLQEMLVEEGRDRATYEAEFALPRSASVQQTLDMLRLWQDAGGTYASVRTMGLNFTSAQQHIDYFAEVRSRLG